MSSSRPRELSIALQSDKRPTEYAALARLVEELGFGTLSVYNDLLFQPPLAPLIYAAQATTRIRLGAASYNPWTLHPVEIAGQIAQLDLISQGRAYWGLSRGAWLDGIGLQQRRAFSRLHEAVDVVEHLIAGRRQRYDGVHFQLSARHRLNYDVLRSRVPLMIGSWGRRTLAFAGERADEVKIGGSSNPDFVPIVAGWIAEGAIRVRRAPADVGVCVGAVTVIDEDRRLARRMVRRQMALYLPVVAPLDPTVNLDPDLTTRIASMVAAGDLDAAGSSISDDLVERFAFSGSPGDIASACERLFATGVTRIEFGTPHGLTAEHGIRLLGDHVASALAPWLH